MYINTGKIGRAKVLLLAAFGRYRWKFLLIAAMGFLSGFSGALGIGVIIPLFALLTGGISGDNFVTRTIRSILTTLHIPFTLQSLLILMAALFIVKAVIQFLARYINEAASADYEYSTRKALFEKTFDASWPFLIDQKIGYLEKVVMRDVSAVSGLVIQISNLIIFATSFLTYGFVAFKISPPIMLLSSVFGLVLFFVFYPILERIRALALKTRDAEKMLAHYINEHILGVKMIKASAAEDVVSSTAKEHFDAFKNIELRSAIYKAWIGSLFEPISFSFIAGLVLFYYNKPAFDIASFAAILYLVQKMFSFVQTGQNSAQSIMANVPYVQSITDYERSVDKNQEVAAGNTFSFNDSVEFNDVRFSYHGNEVLRSVRFKIAKGQTVGLIGPSGAGKTTMADLLLRLVGPTGGSITVDGRNINGTDVRDWRKNIGYMTQEVFLLNDTVENNIRFYDSRLSQEDIMKAAEAANILEFIKELPDGLNTVIGERGVKISGGQRQRVALARILARKPQILILDEATSSLDNQSEALIQESLKKLKGKVTVFVIAHRLSTIMNADKILILDAGTIIEEGSPQELLNDTNSNFYKTYHAHTSGVGATE